MVLRRLTPGWRRRGRLCRSPPHDDPRGSRSAPPAVRHRRRPGRRQRLPDDGRDGDAAGAGAGLHHPQRRSPPPGAHRQGHAPVGLHARERAGGRHHVDGRRRRAGRAAAHAGHRQPHHLDARRRRRGDLGLAQPLRGQRHQVLLARRLQAARRDGAEARAADLREGARLAAAHRHQHRRRGAARRRARPLHRLPQEHLPARADARGPDAGGRLRARRGLPRGAGGAGGAGRHASSPWASSPTARTSTPAAARCTPRTSRSTCSSTRRTWASRSTATPTG